MSYRIAGIDVHKKMLAVVVSNVEIESEFQFERRMFGSNPEQLRSLATWLVEQEAEEVVMESTAQYWKPVWGALEQNPDVEGFNFGSNVGIAAGQRILYAHVHFIPRRRGDAELLAARPD